MVFLIHFLTILLNRKFDYSPNNLLDEVSIGLAAGIIFSHTSILAIYQNEGLDIRTWHETQETLCDEGVNIQYCHSNCNQKEGKYNKVITTSCADVSLLRNIVRDQ